MRTRAVAVSLGVLAAAGISGAVHAAASSGTDAAVSFQCQPLILPSPAASPTESASPSPSHQTMSAIATPPVGEPAPSLSTPASPETTATPSGDFGSLATTSPTPTATPTATATPTTTPTPTATTSATATTTPTEASLCLSVARDSGGVKRGQPATFTVHVWVNGWTPTGQVTVSLVTTAAGQHATFTTKGCHSRDECTIPAPGTAPAELHAQVTAKHPASAITLKAVGKASAATLSQPLAVTESVQLIAPTATAPATSKAPAPEAEPTFAIQPGPFPTLNDISSHTLMSPGNAAGLFPSIAPSAAPATTVPAKTVSPQPSRTNTAQAVEVLPLGMSELTAQIIGVLALVLAVVLAVLTKLLPRRRRTR